jgi:quercetin dioxygenase-like cupin family protein
MKNILLLVLLLSALFFSFQRVSQTQTKPEKTQSEPDRSKPRMVVLKTGDPEFLAFDGGTVRFLVSSEDTNGAWSLLEEVEPPGSKTPWHRHNYSDQAYYVLEGVLTAKVADEVYELPAGSYILIPRGTPHGQGNFGKVPVRVLQMNTPGGFERFLKDRVELFKTMKPDHPDFVKRRAEMRKKVDSELLGDWHVQK